MADGLLYTVTLVNQISAPAKQASTSVQQLTGGLQGMTKASKEAGSDVDTMSGALDAVAPIAGAAAAALALVTGALAAGAAMAIKATEAKAALTSTFDALGRGQITGKQTIAMLDELGESTGLTREKLAPITKEFMAMGVTSVDALKRMTTAAASAQAIMGDPAAAQAFTTLQKKIQEAVDTGTNLKIPAKGLANLADMGLTVDDIAKKMGISANKLAGELKAGTVDAKQFGDALQTALIDKGAGPLQRMANSVDAMKAKFTENITKMFEDVDPGPFIAALKDVGKIFDQNTESGKAMKMLITNIFDGLFKVGARILPILKHGFLELVIAGLKIYIAAKPLVAELKRIFGAGSDDTVSKALIFIVDWMANGIIFTIKFYTVMLRLWEIVGGVAGAMVDFIGSAAKIGSDFVNGLISGITSGATKVVDAVKNLGQQAVNAAKSTLGIHSPSRVMMQLGGHTAEGFARGVDAKAPRAQSAMSSMTSPPAAGGSPSGPAAGVGSITFNVYGVEGAADLKAELPSLLAQAFERLQLMGGT